MIYDRAKATAIRQIGKYGRTVILRQKNAGTYNPGNNTFSNASTNDVNVAALFTEYNEKDVDGTIIQRGDKELLIADLSIGPDTDDLIIDGDDQYKIVNIRTISPGGAVVLYKLQVRR